MVFFTLANSREGQTHFIKKKKNSTINSAENSVFLTCFTKTLLWHLAWIFVTIIISFSSYYYLQFLFYW